MFQQIPCHKNFSVLQILQYTLAPSRIPVGTDTEQDYDFMYSHPYYSACLIRLIRLSYPYKSRPGLINSQPLMYYGIAWHTVSGSPMLTDSVFPLTSLRGWIPCQLAAYLILELHLLSTTKFGNQRMEEHPWRNPEIFFFSVLGFWGLINLGHGFLVGLYHTCIYSEVDIKSLWKKSIVTKGSLTSYNLDIRILYHYNI